MAIDVTDRTFQTEVIEKSKTTPVVVDLWAPWCGPCKTIGPILEKVTTATNGKVILAKVNVDENPQVAGAFRVQSIPAVYAVKDGKVLDGFVGAYPEHVIEEFVKALLPTDQAITVRELLARGDEDSLHQALALEPGNEDVVVALAELLVKRKAVAEALDLLKRVPETDRVRTVAAQARLAFTPEDDYDRQLTELLPRVKADEAARQQFLDILQTMGASDPRTADYRKQLTARLF